MTAADPPIVADGHTHIFNRVYWAPPLDGFPL
jgi:hypothetical protein